DAVEVSQKANGLGRRTAVGVHDLAEHDDRRARGTAGPHQRQGAARQQVVPLKRWQPGGASVRGGGPFEPAEPAFGVADLTPQVTLAPEERVVLVAVAA